jgi:hypothetical protein
MLLDGGFCWFLLALGEAVATGPATRRYDEAARSTSGRPPILLIGLPGRLAPIAAIEGDDRHVLRTRSTAKGL